MAREYCMYKSKYFTEDQARECSALRANNSCHITGDICDVLEEEAQSPPKCTEEEKAKEYVSNALDYIYDGKGPTFPIKGIENAQSP